MLEELRFFPDLQVRHSLVRFCLDACKVSHLLRGSDSRKAWGEVPRLSEALRRSLTDVLREEASDGAWEKATLPIIHSGMGIRDLLRELGPEGLRLLQGLSDLAENASGCRKSPSLSSLRISLQCWRNLRVFLAPTSIHLLTGTPSLLISEQPRQMRAARTGGRTAWMPHAATVCSRLGLLETWRASDVQKAPMPVVGFQSARAGRRPTTFRTKTSGFWPNGGFVYL